MLTELSAGASELPTGKGDKKAVATFMDLVIFPWFVLWVRSSPLQCLINFVWWLLASWFAPQSSENIKLNIGVFTWIYFSSGWVGPI